VSREGFQTPRGRRGREKREPRKKDQKKKKRFSNNGKRGGGDPSVGGFGSRGRGKKKRDQEDQLQRNPPPCMRRGLGGAVRRGVNPYHHPDPRGQLFANRPRPSRKRVNQKNKQRWKKGISLRKPPEKAAAAWRGGLNLLQGRKRAGGEAKKKILKREQRESLPRAERAQPPKNKGEQVINVNCPKKGRGGGKKDNPHSKSRV